MQPQFQTSFIPKKPVLDSQKNGITIVRSTNIFSTLATLIFVITLLASGGLFGYKYYLIKQITEADTALNEARAAFNTGKIQELLDASTRINTVKSLLENHFVVSELLVLLEQLTVKNIHFEDFAYHNNNSTISVNLTGESVSYNALTQQSDIFKGSDFFQNQNFYDLSLTDKGSIKFKFTANILPELVSYKKIIDQLSLNN